MCGRCIKYGKILCCQQLSLECKNRNEFKSKFIMGYRNSHKNGWIDYLYPKSKTNPQ